MKVGIGITAYNRNDVLRECVQNIIKNTFLSKVKIYIATDTDEDRRGVAYRKNECLRALQDCDFIFLFDDDCFPINPNWIDFFINSGYNHLLFMNDKLHKRFHEEETRIIYNDCGGVFMFLTKEVVERVGAFNEKYGLWGFEHADYSNRIEGQRNFYPMLKGTENYIYAKDYSEEGVKSSITDKEKNRMFKENWNKYFNEPEIKYIQL